MSTWYPGAMTYREWMQAESFKEDILSSINKQSNTIIAHQNQARQEISNGLTELPKLIQQVFKGFQMP